MRVYLNKTVFQASLDRLNLVFDEFENIVVWVSGGKDSTVIYHLSFNIAKERGRLPLKVAWIDQEAEWKSTEEWIRKIMYDPNVEPYWFQFPFKLSNATSSGSDFLECWKPGDEWIRDKDPISIKENTFGTDRFHHLFSLISHKLWGDKKTASISGVRAEESPARFIGLTASNTYKGITWGRKNEFNPNHKTFYPIYDWMVSDVWKAIHENHWDYNKIYDFQYQYGMKVQDMRVSNLHHEQSVRCLFYMQEVEPETHNKLIKRLPGVHSATHFGWDDFYAGDLPYMFKDWKDYRDFLLEKLIIPEHQKGLRNAFREHDIEFEDEPCYQKLLRIHVNAIICNDWDERVKVGNADRSFSTKETRRKRDAKKKRIIKEANS